VFFFLVFDYTGECQTITQMGEDSDDKVPKEIGSSGNVCV